jgi:hypothetical protein
MARDCFRKGVVPIHIVIRPLRNWSLDMQYLSYAAIAKEGAGTPPALDTRQVA